MEKLAIEIIALKLAKHDLKQIYMNQLRKKKALKQK